MKHATLTADGSDLVLAVQQEDGTAALMSVLVLPAYSEDGCWRGVERHIPFDSDTPVFSVDPRTLRIVRDHAAPPPSDGGS
jgi:hypothetical protein